MDIGHPKSAIAIGVVFPVLGSIAVGLRFYARSQQKARYMLDDWLMVPALLLMVAQGVSLIVGTAGHGIAYPTPPAGPEGVLLSNSPEKILTQKVEYIATILFVLELLFVKLSLVWFFRRIFHVGNPRVFDKFTKLLISIIIAWGLSFFFAFVFNCGTHVYLQWAPLKQYLTSCNNGLLLEEGFVISDAILDFIILLIPIPLIWNLHMSTKQKIAVLTIMLIGTLTVITSIIRLVIIVTVVNKIAVAFVSNNGDLLVSQVLWWGMVEGGLAVIVACLPTLNFFLKTNWPSSLINGFQSIFSLSSLRSGRGFSFSRSRTNDLDGSSASSRAEFAKLDDSPQGITTYAMRDIEAQYQNSASGQIVVRSNISHLDTPAP